MPALMNSSVGSFTGITEAALIRRCCRAVKNPMNVWRISSLLVGRSMRSVFRPGGRGAKSFSGRPGTGRGFLRYGSPACSPAAAPACRGHRQAALQRVADVEVQPVFDDRLAEDLGLDLALAR